MEKRSERRIRRIAVIVPALAVVATVLGMIPGGIEDVGCCGENPPAAGPMMAGGWTLVAWTVMNALIAYRVYRGPTAKNAYGWFWSALVSIPLGLLAWVDLEHGLRDLSIEWHAVGETMGTCMGAVGLLLLIALPIIASIEDPPAPPDAYAPSARIVA